MKSKQIIFFATATDIEPIIRFIETTYSIKYYEMGMFDNKPNISISSIIEISNFGFPKFGDWNKDMRLIMIPNDKLLVIRDVPQRTGGIKYAVDQMANPTSAGIQLGGIFKEGVLLGGTFGIVDVNDFSSAVFKSFSSKIKKGFKKIGSFYVGKKAEEKLRSGWRLVTNEKSPKEYDLTLS